MFDFKSYIAEKIQECTKLEGSLKEYIEVPPNSEMGDYAFPCFRLAKELKKAPPMIANDIKENIKVEENVIEKIDIAGGYLNFYINKELLVKENSGLIWSVTRRFIGRGVDSDDLYQLGCLGFLKAVDGFDLLYGIVALTPADTGTVQTGFNF